MPVSKIRQTEIAQDILELFSLLDLDKQVWLLDKLKAIPNKDNTMEIQG